MFQIIRDTIKSIVRATIKNIGDKENEKISRNDQKTACGFAK